MSSLVDPQFIRTSEEQIDAAARLLVKRDSRFTIDSARAAIVDLATHDVTDDTFWRQGLSFVFVVYSGGRSFKLAEICVCPLEAEKLQ